MSDINLETSKFLGSGKAIVIFMFSFATTIIVVTQSIDGLRSDIKQQTSQIEDIKKRLDRFEEHIIINASVRPAVIDNTRQKLYTVK